MSEDQLDYTGTQYVAADATGRILYRGAIPAFMFEIQSAPDGGVLVIGSGDADTHYVKGGQIVERPANTAVLAGLQLTSLPAPCTINVDGVDHDCTDDHCDLSFSQPGTYAVTVKAWPMRDATFEVTQP